MSAPIQSAREGLIAGLRALADFYEANPTMPVPAYPQLLVGGVNNSDDTAGVRRVEVAAEVLGTEIDDLGGHLSTERKFAGLAVRVYHVPTARMDRFYAAQTYADSVQPEDGTR